MIKNHIRTAWRTLMFNRTYSITNLVGLSIGLSVGMLIATYILNEWSYDRQWSLRKELYRLYLTQQAGPDEQAPSRWMNPPRGLGEALKDRFPEVADYTNIHIRSYLPPVTLSGADGRTRELEALEADTNFFNLFDIKVLDGDPRHIYAHVHNLVITESTHRHHFGGADVVGELFRQITPEGEEEQTVITAIIQDIPRNSHLHTQAILIGSHHHAFTPGTLSGNLHQYLRVRKGARTDVLKEKINNWYAAVSEPDALRAAGLQRTAELGLQPISDVHLHTSTGAENKLPVWDLYLLGGIGLLIILFVCINFINLSFAHAVKRTSDAGIRKVLGAEKRHFIGQLAAETGLLFGGGFLLALPVYFSTLPLFERHLGHALNFTFLTYPLLLLILLTLWLLLGMICAVPPGLAATKTNVADGLRKRLQVFNLPMDRSTTRWLVGFQFCGALVLTLCMVTTAMQLHFIHQKDLGYQPDNLLVMKAYQPFGGQGEAFKQSLLQDPAITSVSLASWTPFDGAAEMEWVDNPEHPDQREMIVFIGGDIDYPETMGMELISGRFLQDQYAMDAVIADSVSLNREIYSNVLVSEMTMANFGLKLNEGSPAIRSRPVGVVRDFHGASLRFPVPNLVIRAHREIDRGLLLARIAKGAENQALANIQAHWKTFFPDRLPRMTWMDEQVKAQYLDEERQFQQLLFFSCLSVLIALLGILGIAIYTVERRTKEIGIRKVLGASEVAVTAMICKSFAPLLIVGTLIAFPLAWWLMDRWLMGYAYRINVPVLFFLVTTAGMMLLTFLVVGLRVWATARTNPVHSLRDD